MRYAIVSGNTVENVITWDGTSDYAVPPGQLLVADADGWAECGGYYEDGLFYPPKPFPSWVFDSVTRTWSAPEPYPQDGIEYVWEESLGIWWPINQGG